MRIGRIIALTGSIVVLAACQKSLEQRVAEEAKEMTETKCPMPVGDNMLLDSVVFDMATHTQSQYFSVMGELDDDSLFAQTDTRTLLVDELLNAPSYRPLMERGVIFYYLYRSHKNPEHILMELTLTPEDYKNKK